MWVLLTRLGLPTPGRDLPHHLSANHADLIKDQQARGGHLGLKAVEGLAVLCQLRPLARAPHLESVKRRGRKANIESSATGRGGDVNEAARVAVSLQDALQLL